MKTEIIKVEKGKEKECAKKTAMLLKKSKIAVFPSETSYGIACNALDKKAVEKIYRIKGRPKQKSMPVMVSSIAMMKKYCKMNRQETALAKEFMPGPFALVLENKKNGLFNKADTVAIRISSGKFAFCLSRFLGKPAVCTSANLSGKPQLYSGKSATALLEGKVDCVADAGRLKKTSPSTIYSQRQGKVFRKGPVSERKINCLLKGLE